MGRGEGRNRPLRAMPDSEKSGLFGVKVCVCVGGGGGRGLVGHW